MSADSIFKNFELEYSGSIDGIVPVYKYKALRSGVHITFAQIEGPRLKGYFCLATEAHDDDGLPEAVKCLIPMGSEDYPYKGVIELSATECFGSDLGGWTEVDHTTYKMDAKGSEGFLKLMPVYLDHILFPLLKDSAYTTEIHHINGEGEDGGVLYEASGYQIGGYFISWNEMLRQMYPGHCGYKSVTGGVMKNIRESTSLDKVKAYHTEFYRPENLCIIVAGMVEPLDVLKTFLKFEEKIVRRPVDRPVYVRPWQSDVPPLPASVERTVKYGCDVVDIGSVNIAWRGPTAKNQADTAALMILFEYLTYKHLITTSGSPLMKEFVESEESDGPCTMEISYVIFEFSVGCLLLRFDHFPCQILHQIKPRLLKVLHSLSADENIDMERMHELLRYQYIEALTILEDRPHFDVVSLMIKDFLYGNSKEETDAIINKVAALRDLLKEPASYWTALLKKYLIDKNCVTIIGEPSEALLEELNETEKKRVAEQKERLKEEGLAEKKKLLELAVKENEVQPPAELLLSIPVTSMSSVQFRSVKSSCNYTQDSSLIKSEKFRLDEIPISFQLDDINSNFAKITMLMDGSVLPEELNYFLPVYTKLVLNYPILMRNGTLISTKEVIKELKGDVMDCGSSYDVYRYGIASSGMVTKFAYFELRFKVDKYLSVVQWFHELMYKAQYDVEGLKKVLDDLVDREGAFASDSENVAEILMAHLTKSKDSNYYTMVKLQKFLKEILEKLEADSSYSTEVLEKLNKLKVELTDPARLRVHMSAHVDRLVTQTGLSDAVSVWSNVFLPSAQQKYRVKSSMEKQKDYEQQKSTVRGDSAHDNLIDSSSALIIGVDEVRHYLILTTPCLIGFMHPDVPAIKMYIQYLSMDKKGPLSKQIGDLAVEFEFSLKWDEGYLKFVLKGSHDIVDAYRLAKKVVEEYSRDNTNFDSALIESCKRDLIMDKIYSYETVWEVTQESLAAFLRGVPHGYTRWLLDRIPEVSVDDMRRVSKLYFTSLFSPTQSKLSLCTDTGNVEEICQKFKEEFQREFAVVESVEKLVGL